MPENKPIGRARKDAREGKSPTTQAGEFVREEIEHVREGKHGARSVRQAIAIALSKARRAGVKLPPPKKGKTSARTRAQALRDYRKGRAARRGKVRKVSRRRSRAVLRALRRESRGTASRRRSQGPPQAGLISQRRKAAFTAKFTLPSPPSRTEGSSRPLALL